MKLLNIFTLMCVISSALCAGRYKRVVGGYYAENNSFPYQVGIRLYIYNENLPTWCGGSIINHEWLLTAAHCTQNAKSADIFLGSTNISSAAIIYAIDRNSIIEHPSWKDTSQEFTNDISLIKIPHITYSAQIQPIEFPSDDTYVGSLAVVSGWGYTAEEDNLIIDELKWSAFKVMNTDDCLQAYPTSINSNNICVATTTGNSTCQGDSGGPLVLKDTNVLIGVTSFVSGAGCSKGYPAVFTRVSKYIDWIRSYTGNSTKSN